MGSSAAKLLEEALALPEDERAELVDALTSSLSGELSDEWKTEIASRIEAVENGDEALIPGDEVTARLQRALREIG